MDTPATRPHAARDHDPLRPGTHSFRIGGITQRYHVYGSGPVCVAHSGGPGIFWEYLRMPLLEEHLTMIYVEPIGTGESGRLPSHPHGYTRERYSRFLEALINRLGVPEVYLLGHSHGAFVAAYHALHRPERLAGVILYEGAPVNGPEHSAETARMLEQFVANHRDLPELPEILAGFGKLAGIRSDEETVAVLRKILPVYFADYWSDADRWAPVRDTMRAAYISDLDEELSTTVFDDRAALKELTVPALVLVGRYDFICGLRWGRELHELIPGSRLAVMENSGHLGHVEEPGPFNAAVRDFVLGR